MDHFYFDLKRPTAEQLIEESNEAVECGDYATATELLQQAVDLIVGSAEMLLSRLRQLRN